MACRAALTSIARHRREQMSLLNRVACDMREAYLTLPDTDNGQTPETLKADRLIQDAGLRVRVAEGRELQLGPRAMRAVQGAKKQKKAAKPKKKIAKAKKAKSDSNSNNNKNKKKKATVKKSKKAAPKRAKRAL